MIFPGICPVCSKSMENQGVCGYCRQRFKVLAKPKCNTLEYMGRCYKTYGIYDYDNKFIKEYIFKLKRKAGAGLFEFAARDVINNLMPMLEKEKYWLCYVPRSRINTRLYGYDHAKCISKKISKLGKSVEFCKLLKRHGFSKEQKRLDAQQRAKNVKGKFKAKALSGKTCEKIIVFDDISTTGNTFISCAQALEKVYPEAEIIGVFICC